MFRRNSIPILIGILALTSLFLMGQQPGCQPPPAPVAKTGQTSSYATGDDGDLEKGVSWPVPRFTDNVDGTVTDNLTGLIWTKNANCDGKKTWSDALNYCNTLADGTCGLADGAVAGDWRLANRFELESLLDIENSFPALPTGHPFTNVETGDWYWSSTTYAMSTNNAWYVYFAHGIVYFYYKDSAVYSWCVRGGQ
jgi:hypothetical protein